MSIILRKTSLLDNPYLICFVAIVILSVVQYKALRLWYFLFSALLTYLIFEVFIYGFINEKSKSKGRDFFWFFVAIITGTVITVLVGDYVHTITIPLNISIESQSLLIFAMNALLIIALYRLFRKTFHNAKS